VWVRCPRSWVACDRRRLLVLSSEEISAGAMSFWRWRVIYVFLSMYAFICVWSKNVVHRPRFMNSICSCILINSYLRPWYNPITNIHDYNMHMCVKFSTLTTEQKLLNNCPMSLSPTRLLPLNLAFSASVHDLGKQTDINILIRGYSYACKLLFFFNQRHAMQQKYDLLVNRLSLFTAIRPHSYTV